MRSITAFRAVVAELMDDYPHADVVVLAIDGLSWDAAARAWPDSVIEPLRSVFPTTSSAAWLSSLTGQTVTQHRVPGVMMRGLALGVATNVFDYRGAGLTDVGENIFSDARLRGRHSVAIAGDLRPRDCSWRRELLRYAAAVADTSFYTDCDQEYVPRAPDDLACDLSSAIGDVLASRPAGKSCLIWCFIELDRHVHRHGYDGHTQDFLANVKALVNGLCRQGVVVVAHSDHGLIPTRHDTTLGDLLAASTPDMGGAGRCRWLYPLPGTAADVFCRLKQCLPDDVGVFWSRELFGDPTLCGGRVGEIAVVAKGERFITEPGYTHDHGSMLPVELQTALAVWAPRSSR